MNRTRISYLGVLAGLMIGAAWYFVGQSPRVQTGADSQVEACDSCSARHQNLTRLRDARNLTGPVGE